MPIITDEGFQDAPTPNLSLLSLAALESGGGDAPFALEVNNDADPIELAQYFGQTDLIAIAFPSFADGRGFSLARRLRHLGYKGRLRAKGHVISDQYAMARACGFDEVEIDDAQAARQPEAHWIQAKNAADVLANHALQARPKAVRGAMPMSRC